MVKKKHRVIDRTYGIATSDTAALKEMMNKLESKHIPEANLYTTTK
jgi:hypothetical protein